MEDKNFAEIIEKIGDLLSDFINDSEELKSLLDELKESGQMPAISVEARLTLFEEIDDDFEIVEETQLLLPPVNYDKEFEESITSDDVDFLKSLNIKL